jgi:hypothetical protein
MSYGANQEAGKYVHHSMVRIIIRETVHLWVYQTKKDYIISAGTLGGPTNKWDELCWVPECTNLSYEANQEAAKNEQDSIVWIVIMEIVYLWVYRTKKDYIFIHNYLIS